MNRFVNQVSIRAGEKNAVVVLDIYERNDNVEIVGWRSIDEDGLKKMEKQARKEGGQFLILSPISRSAADLSALQSNLPSEGKDNKVSELIDSALASLHLIRPQNSIFESRTARPLQ